MKLPLLLLALSLTTRVCALGFADGVKIGEVTDTSAILWARLTQDQDALNRIPKWTPEKPNWSTPGAAGRIRFLYWKPATETRNDARETDWLTAAADHDFCVQQTLPGLSPATRYAFEAVGESQESNATIEGSFTTAPGPATGEPITFTVSTCQEFELRDDPQNGHKIYHSMLGLKPAFFLQTGDTVYYDRKKPLAKNIDLARYRWNRMYALPFQREFHRHIPTYWMHDDHDILKDDASPGQSYGDLTWEQGLKVWREQVPQSEKPYRTFRWGKNLQIWLPEGREYRSPNSKQDGPDKSILGKEQWQWLEQTMKTSDATFKLYISATPVVGPDRDQKNDNHANAGFQYEGERLRKLLSSIPGCFVVNGDRHWQYHSIDPQTGLNEFGCGPASDAHAQGWKQSDKRPEHQFLRVKGGFAVVTVSAEGAVVTHCTVDGEPVYKTTIPAP